MITMPRSAPCTKCIHNPRVFQPSIENEKEWLQCDNYQVIPVDILRSKTKCEFYEKIKEE